MFHFRPYDRQNCRLLSPPDLLMKMPRMFLQDDENNTTGLRRCQYRQDDEHRINTAVGSRWILAPPSHPQSTLISPHLYSLGRRP